MVSPSTASSSLLKSLRSSLTTHGVVSSTSSTPPGGLTSPTSMLLNAPVSQPSSPDEKDVSKLEIFDQILKEVEARQSSGLGSDLQVQPSPEPGGEPQSDMNPEPKAELHPPLEDWSAQSDLELPTQPAVSAPAMELAGPVEPVAEALEPIAEMNQPVAQPLEPIAETHQPVAQPLEPIAETHQPVVQPLEPITETHQPLAQHDSSPLQEPSPFDGQVLSSIAQPQINPVVSPSGHSAKERYTSSIDSAAVEAATGIQYLEQERVPEIPVEVEGFLQHVEDHPEQLPNEIVIGGDQQATLAPHTPKQAVIVVPITPEIERTAQGKSASLSVRWLVEFAHKIMKMFSGKVVYKQEKV